MEALVETAPQLANLSSTPHARPKKKLIGFCAVGQHKSNKLRESAVKLYSAMYAKIGDSASAYLKGLKPSVMKRCAEAYPTARRLTAPTHTLLSLRRQ